MASLLVIGYGDIGEAYFPNYDNDTRQFLMSILEWSDEAFIFDFSVTHYTHLLCAIVLVFHITILSTKDLRMSSINIIMIGFCVADIFSFTLMFYGYYMYGTDSIDSDTCIPDDTPVATIFMFWSFVSTFNKRISTWLQVLMVIVRSVAMKFAGNPIVDNLTRALFGWKVIAACVIFCLPLSLVEFYRMEFLIYENMDDYYEGCEEEDQRLQNVTFPSYSLTYRDWFYENDSLAIRIFYFFEAFFFEFLPCLFSPLFTALLVLQLNAVNRMRNSLLYSDKKDKTNKLVIYMSICFMVIQIPVGFMYTVQIYLVEQPGMTLLLLLGIQLVGYLNTLKACSHCVLCYLLSQQYRNTVINFIFNPVMWKVSPKSVILVTGSHHSRSTSNNMTLVT